jgi:hypothetical protein
MKNALEPNPKPTLPTNTKEYKEYAWGRDMNIYLYFSEFIFKST